MFRFDCLVALGGGSGTADKCHWSVWGALAVFPPHWVCPRSPPVCFPRLHCSGSRLLYREQALSCMYFPGLSSSSSGSWVLHKGADSVGPEFCAFPCPSSSGDQELDERTLPGCDAPYPLCGPSLSFPRASWVLLVSLLAATLPVDVNRPGSQENLAGNKVYLQFGRGCPLPSGSGCRLPASLPLVGRWAGPQPANSPLLFAQSFLL